MLTTLNIAIAACALILGVVRAVESIYELRKKPDLDSIGKIWQILKNFFTIESYKPKAV